jgi:rod shape-determining protein MreC
MMLVTFGTDVFNRPLNTAAGYVVVPFQQGIGKLGEWLSGRKDELVQIRTLLEENESLKEQVAALTEENTLLQQDKYELNTLRQLMELDEEYGNYNKVGARIIGRDSGNWYSSFIIDKGSDDGLGLDMNVIADGGLVGRITSIGANWARVTSIISDNSNVSGMTLSTQDNLIVSGDLKLMADGCISFTQLIDSKDMVREGDKVVTSDISDKYLPNILIGYISSIDKDSNNLTKSGMIVPAVDFEHLGEVLVITDMKQTIDEE